MNEQIEVWPKEKHYREGLSSIVAIGQDYDGYDPKNADSMRELVDDLVELAGKALEHKALLLKDEGGVMVPVYRVEGT